MDTFNSFVQAQKQLNNLEPIIKLVILHPDFHGQHRLFSVILNEPDANTFFLSVPEPSCTLDMLLNHLQRALQAQFRVPLDITAAQPEHAAQAIAEVLAQHHNPRIILDAYDMLNQDEVTPFVVALINALSGDSRVYLGARELPMQLIEHEDIQGKIALLPVNADNMMLDYAQSSDQTVLEVRALGPGRVLINGRLIDHWDGVLPRTLFFYFVDRGMTTRDEIFNTFWPNLSTREATNVFHVTKRKISEILETDLTVYWSGFYRISPDLELHYDVLKFAEAVQNAAVASEDQAVTLLQNANELYHGPFLSTMDQDWVTNRRDELAMTYAEALSGLARIYRDRDDKLNALGYYLRAAATNPQREDLARAIMELYRDLGQFSFALETYDRLEAEIKRTLNVSPAPQTIALSESIRSML